MLGFLAVVGGEAGGFAVLSGAGLGFQRRCDPLTPTHNALQTSIRRLRLVPLTLPTPNPNTNPNAHPHTPRPRTPATLPRQPLTTTTRLWHSLQRMTSLRIPIPPPAKPRTTTIPHKPVPPPSAQQPHSRSRTPRIHKLALRRQMRVVFIRKTQSTPGADLSNGVDGVADLGVDGAQYAREGEVRDGGEGWAIDAAGFGSPGHAWRGWEEMW